MAVLRPRHHDLITRRSVLAGLAALPACRAGGAADVATVGSWSPAPAALPAGFHRGMNLAHLHRRGWGYGSDRAASQVDALVALGVTHLALNPFAYVKHSRDTTIRRGGDDSLSDDDLRAQIAQAHARGLTVMLKPHLWAWTYLAGESNTTIRHDAAGWRAWFESYTAWAVHNARIAEETGCAWMTVGLEFTEASRANPGAWARVAEACRAVYRGKLLYAANWYEEYALFADWDAFDAIGVNAYFPLEGDTVDALAASWGPHLDAVEQVAKGRPVLFPEAGYRAVTGGTREPWNGAGAPDPERQARAYEALMRACTRRPWFGGVYWWKWFTDAAGEAGAYGGDGDRYVPEEPTRRVLRAWFA